MNFFKVLFQVDCQQWNGIEENTTQFYINATALYFGETWCWLNVEVCVKDWNYPSLSNCCLNCIIYLWHLGFFFIIAQHWCILYPWSLVKLVHVLLLLFGSSKILDVQIKIGLLSTDLKNKDSFYVIVLIRYFLQDFQVKICL